MYRSPMLKHGTILVDERAALEERLDAALANVPRLKVMGSGGEVGRDRDWHGVGFDRIVAIEHHGRPLTLLVEALSNGQPREVARAIGLLKLIGVRTGDEYPVVLAPQLSDRSAAMCESAGVGYLDLTGRCRLAFGSVYIKIGPGAALPRERRGLRSLYTLKGTRAIRAMLCEPRRKWTVQELAAVAQISTGQASNIKRLLDDHLRLTVEGGRFRLAEPVGEDPNPVP